MLPSLSSASFASNQTSAGNAPMPINTAAATPEDLKRLAKLLKRQKTKPFLDDKQKAKARLAGLHSVLGSIVSVDARKSRIMLTNSQRV